MIVSSRCRWSGKDTLDRGVREMTIRRVRIENYRSDREADFALPCLCALIGGNNSGKSNVLRAINLVLGDRWPSVNRRPQAVMLGRLSDRRNRENLALGMVEEIFNRQRAKVEFNVCAVPLYEPSDTIQVG